MALPNPETLLSVIEKPKGPLKDFADCFDALIGSEKGFSDHPDDPGGATMWGVTERVARKWGYTGDMRSLPLSTARDIAYSEYWKPNRCDEMPVPVAYEVFDTAYNGGDGIRWLQYAVRAKVDGVLGPVTLNKARLVDPDDIIARFNALRILYLVQLKTFPTFSRGWMRRIAAHLLQGAENEDGS